MYKEVYDFTTVFYIVAKNDVFYTQNGLTLRKSAHAFLRCAMPNCTVTVVYEKPAKVCQKLSRTLVENMALKRL